jgi:hypothetical protein
VGHGETGGPLACCAWPAARGLLRVAGPARTLRALVRARLGDAWGDAWGECLGGVLGGGCSARAALGSRPSRPRRADAPIGRARVVRREAGLAQGAVWRGSCTRPLLAVGRPPVHRTSGRACNAADTPALSTRERLNWTHACVRFEGYREDTGYRYPYREGRRIPRGAPLARRVSRGV